MPASLRAPSEDGASSPVVLIVEDVVLVRLLIADSLRARGFNVIEAADGEQAVQALEAGLPVHAVLTDIYMPGASLNGIELARWIRSHRPELPVFLGSGVHTDLPANEAALSSGPLLVKPYNFDTLAKRLRAALHQ